MNLNIFNLIIISGIIQGVVFTLVVLFNKKYKSNTSKYIAFVVLFLSLSNFQYWLIDIEFAKAYPFLKFLFIPWQWLITPMFFLFLNHYFYEKKADKRLPLLLFSPFAIVCVLLLIQAILALSTSYKIPEHFESGFFIYVDYASLLFNLLVLYLAYKKVNSYKKLQSHKNTTVKRPTDWILRLIYIGLVVCLVWLSSLCFTLFYNANSHYLFYATWLGISFLIYWLGYVALEQLSITKQREKIRKVIKSESKPITELSKASKENPVFSKFKSLIIDDELYLNPGLKLSFIADLMNISPNYLSRILNEENALNFNDFINLHRINRAKELLLNDDFKLYTNNAIGLESGFNSKSTFFYAFKKYTGITPTEYKKKVKNSGIIQ
ncbi:helix-turn-helix domain-containing protein [Cellulophaga fucicola]|uniref:helix-turn-helix domain-containing protein n=1 Tax=Cellulophaga fucicola TaxID=76595 RepID=UPI003EBE21F3